MPKSLTIALLQKVATAFAKAESKHAEKSLFGVTDGKAVGTYLEHKFQTALQSRYVYARGSSAKGIDFPKLGVDIKVTSIRQAEALYDKIVAGRHGKAGGFLDVFAWRGRKRLFVEYKGEGDKLKKNQLLWIRAAIKSEVSPTSLLLVEFKNRTK